MFESYFLKHHREDLAEILQEEQDVEQHYPVFVKYVWVWCVVVKCGGGVKCCCVAMVWNVVVV